MGSKTAFIEHLLTFITENKREKILAVLANRTRYITVVLEDLFQEHNASAALRSCDIFGIQDVHVVEAQYKFRPNTAIAMGSSKWVDVHSHTSITDSITALKQQGYRIVATTPHLQSYSLPELPLDQKTALIFGSEQTGLSPEALNMADMYVKIPMYGFVESFNVSVSVALCLYDIIQRLHNSSYSWQLTEQEKQDIMLAWIAKISPTAAALKKQLAKK